MDEMKPAGSRRSNVAGSTMARTSPPLHRTALAALLALAGCQVTYLYIGSDVIPGGTSGTGGAGGSGSTSTGSASTTTSSGAGAATTSGAGGGPACMPGATQPCYDGPAGTEGVGTCKGGTQTCPADGGAWGPCVGEVLPQPPDCAGGMDLHCDGTVPTCTGNVLWAKRFGDASDQLARAVAADPSGNVVVVGGFKGSLDFGNGAPLQGTPGGSAFVTKLNGADGSYAWANGYSAGMSPNAYAAIRTVAVSVSGDVLATGDFNGSLDLGVGTVTSTGSYGDAMLLKLDGKTGAYAWSKTFAYGEASTPGVQIAGTSVNAANDVLISGVYFGSVDFGGGAIQGCGSILCPTEIDRGTKTAECPRFCAERTWALA